MAEREFARKQDFERTLDCMCQQLGQLRIVDRLPKDLDELEFIVNRAMDVRSAFMVYLGTHIRHQGTSAGTIGSRPALHFVDLSRKSCQDFLLRR